MSKILVLAEKPSVGRELAAVLGCKNKENGYISGPQYIVTWALGHLVTLADPEVYGEKYKKWSIEYLPMLPEKTKLTVIPETSKQFTVVKKLLLSKEISSLIIATDAGREGELVARWIIEKADYKGPIKRLWISSQTSKAIKDGFANLKDGSEYINLANAAKARAGADWFVGLNVTRALTCRHNAQLSAGRVQTPTLSLIVKREEEIKNFKSKEYFNLRADFGGFSALWKNKKGLSAISSVNDATELANKVSGKMFTVKSIEKSEKKTPCPMLYDLTELQRDANKLYKLSPKQTLSVMQSLYEVHKALTYPRTDSRYLTTDIVPTLTDRIKACAVGSLSAISSEVIRNRYSISKLCINNAKVSDHHAIIPTEEKPDIMSMSSDERKIYLLVATRFLSCFYPEYKYNKTNAVLEYADECFYCSGKQIIDEGWKKVSLSGNFDDDELNENDDIEEESDKLPDMKNGDKIKCVKTSVHSLKTKAPSRYTEATLLSAMENPSRFVESKEMKAYLGAGLGTPATRADIIEKLYSCFYIEKRDNVIYPTQKGIQIINIVPHELKEPLLTAKWEQQLELISKGKENKDEFLDGIKKYTKTLVNEVVSSDAKYVHENVTRTPCPVCGKMMLEVNGKKGKMLVCQDRECGYRESLSVKTGARCPECHKQMELRGKGDKRLYVCKCGFKQRFEIFNEQKKANSGGANKHFVQSFLKNQEKSAPKEESAFAKALLDSLKK